METNNLENKLDQLNELLLKFIVYSMSEDGHTLDEIAKNLHLGKQTVVKILDGLKKKKE